MFFNYLKIAFRNLIRHKVYTGINLLGLSIGMTACILMLLFVREEISYDKFHSKADNIIRVVDTWTSTDNVEHLATSPFPVGRVLQVENPEVIRSVVRFYRPTSWGNDLVLSVGTQSYAEKDFLFSDSTFFEIFSFDFLQGDQAALKTPNQVVITAKTAKKYFGEENPLGQQIRFNNQLDLTVGAVLKDIPANSHIKFDFITSLATLRNWWGGDGYENNWVWQSAWTYLLLEDPSGNAAIAAQLPDFVNRHFPESVREGSSLELQALTDIHLHSQRYLEVAANGNIVYVYIFSAIAILILLIACINFMNLATARSASRAKEVGMRKVLGAYRSTLIGQFLGESILLSMCALILTIAMIELSLPLFNSLTGKSLAVFYLQDWQIVSGMLFIGMFVGVIAGSYPAFFLSGFRPILVLKGIVSGNPNPAKGKSSLRWVLVVSQFTVSLLLLISINVIYNQLDYLKNKDLGINKEQVVFIDMFGDALNNYEPMKNALLNHPGIQAVSRIGGSVPGTSDGIANAYVPEGMSADKPMWIGMLTASHDIEAVLDLEFVSGRTFSKDFPTDSEEAFLINEAAAKEFGWDASSALGKKLDRVRTNGSIRQSGKVVGVVKDFHYQSLHESLKALVIRFGGHRMAVRLNAGNVNAGMAHIRETWGQFITAWPLSFQFLDKNLERLYRSEESLSLIIQYFTLLAIFIACLGLFGLASFTTENRTKEIGVRKVLGASVPGLILLISREFTRLVFIAFLIAAPLGYWVMNKWLGNFAYRIDIGAWVFLSAGALALGIALLTISYQAIKVALSNPVDALRYE